MSLQAFHPAVAAWFSATFPAPTPPQLQAWQAIQSGRDALIAAPTGSGKTLAAFLAAIDELVRRGVELPLPDETAVVYVSPLKALSNDIRINLENPLAGIRAQLERLGLPDVDITTAVRTGDTPTAERDRMRRRPPHIVVTTPESLYILLGSESGRRMLSTTRSVIVDEIHALAPNKRGSHLALSLQRLDALCSKPPIRIGLSATQKPIEDVAAFLVGAHDRTAPRDCAIVDVGYTRERDLALELPQAPLEAVMSGDAWEQVYVRLTELVETHRTTLVFVNTRRMAERAARHLGQRLGIEAVAAHHGSLSREIRLDAERRLKNGELRVLVATASLELGIDIGDVDLVCQLGSPRAIAAFLQRVGRSGHAVGATPKGRLFPQSRDDLVECAALLDAVRRGELDRLAVPPAPLDVLAQQITAEVASREWNEDELFALFTRAQPYSTLARDEFNAVVRMLADGFTTRRGPRSAYLHRDAVNGVLRGRRGARLTAVTSGGAIPDTADYDVMLEPEAVRIGSVHEDFAVESLQGDVFQLGNHAYRILRVERGRLRVEDAKGQPPNIPFWLGEAPGRSDELSVAVSRLRAGVGAAIRGGGALPWLEREVGLDASGARQIADYLGAAQAALGTLPTRHELVMERFFDESGGTQLVIHSPFGSRVNRAWGLALRKRFCRKFNFELQAAATEDAIVLSLSTSHSFPLDDVARYLHSTSVRDVLIQALLDAPLFGVRWRWNATTALALPRTVGGVRVAPQLQRMKSEDLLASVFPDQVACAENLVGEREIPDHPLVAQTIRDCLHEAMDIDGLIALLQALESGDARIVARDLTGPSPLAAEVLSARPYAFLDDAPLEERRTQAVMARRYGGEAAAVDDLGRLDPDAIAAVRLEAWPEARDADELHDALMGLTFLSAAEVDAEPGWNDHLERLVVARRAVRVPTPGGDVWTAAERLPLLRALLQTEQVPQGISIPTDYDVAWSAEDAAVEIVRGRLTGLGPARATDLAAPLGADVGAIGLALLRLESEGYVMRGRFSVADGEEEWCERHLLARIHRYTVHRLRREVEPVQPRDFVRFLADWQRVSAATRLSGPESLAQVLEQLEGFEAPASAWESEILPARIADYRSDWLDDACRAGRVVWTRLRGNGGAGPVRSTPIVLLQRKNLSLWTPLAAGREAPALSSRAQAVADELAAHGATFFDELVSSARLLPAELEDALGELVAAGLANADSFAGLRALLVPSSKRVTAFRGRRRPVQGVADAGRWALVRRGAADAKPAPESIEHVARTLLARYGVVCWRLIEREAAWLPPWRDIVRVLHRLEARGEIRGGRFVAGLTGEQFALPEAVGLLRKIAKGPDTGDVVTVSGADPLNLVGGVVAGAKVPAVTGTRLAYRDGVPVATLVAGKVEMLGDTPDTWPLRQQLLRDPRTGMIPGALGGVG